MLVDIVSTLFFGFIVLILLDGARLMVQDAQKRYEIRKKLQEDASNEQR
tara:strand:- start:269 stop:415 length:147 start_codon:yes stop_codon:yes gene_type:complete